MFDRLFLSHPRSVGETWAEHAVMATRFGLAMLAGGLACLLHALVPGLCVRTGSRTIADCGPARIRTCTATISSTTAGASERAGARPA